MSIVNDTDKIKITTYNAKKKADELIISIKSMNNTMSLISINNEEMTNKRMIQESIVKFNKYQVNYTILDKYWNVLFNLIRKPLKDDI